MIKKYHVKSDVVYFYLCDIPHSNILQISWCAMLHSIIGIVLQNGMIIFGHFNMHTAPYYKHLNMLHNITFYYEQNIRDKV